MNIAHFHLITADIVHRLPNLVKDSPQNAQDLIESLLKPAFEQAIKTAKIESLNEVRGNLSGNLLQDHRYLTNAVNHL